MAKYSAEDIEVLDGLSGVRSNVGMYLGPSEGQVFQILREVVENSMDVHIKGMNSFISIAVISSKQSQRFVVIDHGPGIPVEKHKKTGESTLTTVLTKLHAGSNFDKQAKGKVASRGKHGVGVSASNACSSKFTVWTNRDKKWFTQSFEKGVAVTEVTQAKLLPEYKELGARNQGTIIDFTPDYSILPKTRLKAKDLFEWGNTIANLSTKLKVRVNVDGETEEYINKNGIISILDWYKETYGGKKVEYIGKPFIFENDFLSVALQWGSLEGEEHTCSYVNYASVPGLGTHVQGAYDAITKAFKAIGGRSINFTASDLREGMILVIHYKCTDDDYAGQNKEKLNSPTAVNRVKEALEKPLIQWINKNKTVAKEIVKRASDISNAKQQARELTRAASNVKISKSKRGVLLAGKLAMCDKSTPPEQIELFLVEGDSAGGNAKQARSAKFQEVLACRGKGLNVVKATLAKALANEEIAKLLIALSGGDTSSLIKTGNISTFRVGKILLMSDADVDGPLDGKTKVCMLDGSKKTLKELATKWKKDHEPFWVLSRDSKGNLIPAMATAPRVTTETDIYYEVTFDNGFRVKCTPNHKWVVNYCEKSNCVTCYLGNTYLATEHLSVGDSINSFYTETSNSDGTSSRGNKKYPLNHKIVSIEKLTSPKPKQFYCLTVEKTGNFFIDDGDGNGICSANCHIDALWITMLLRFAPAAFSAGMVYKVLSPLYIDNEDKSVYGFSLDEIKKKMKPNHYSRIVRCKGLGEFTPSQLEPFMNPKTRKLIQIDLPNKKQLLEFEQLMGNSTEYRRNLLGIKERG